MRDRLIELLDEMEAYDATMDGCAPKYALDATGEDYHRLYILVANAVVQALDTETTFSKICRYLKGHRSK